MDFSLVTAEDEIINTGGESGYNKVTQFINRGGSNSFRLLFALIAGLHWPAVNVRCW